MTQKKPSKRGPKAAPTEALRISNRTGIETGNSIDPPPHLGPVALDEWHRVLRVLGPAKLLSEGDLALLAVRCDAWATFVRACEAIAEEGDVVLFNDGKTVGPSPWVKVKALAEATLRQTSNAFGLSPGARARTRITGQGGEKIDPGAGDDFDAFVASNPTLKRREA